MEKILSGKPVSTSILDSIKTELSALSLVPKMALVMAGSDPASSFYVKNITKQGSKLGMEINLIELPETISNQELQEKLHELGRSADIHGIMLQKPLPGKINEQEIDNCLNPDKDIDGIHPLNLGKLFLAQDCYVPCTAAATLELIRFYKIETRGKHIVILGRSAVVAKPLAGLLLQKAEFGNATVTICHSYTKNLAEVTKSADILISAIGKPRFVTADMIKADTICLDVGINLIKDEEKGDIYVGDFDYEDCLSKSRAITPVPGGIGSITTSVLLRNLLKAAILHKNKEKELT